MSIETTDFFHAHALVEKKKIKPNNKKRNSLETAGKLMMTPQNQLPPLALEYAHHLCQQYGLCGEVFVTAFAHYAQAVRHEACKDSLYKIDAQGRQWFKEKKKEVTI